MYKFSALNITTVDYVCVCILCFIVERYLQILVIRLSDPQQVDSKHLSLCRQTVVALDWVSVKKYLF